MKLQELFENAEASGFLTDPEEIKAWLKKCTFGKWQSLTIDSDGTTHCKSDVTLDTGKNTSLRVKFGIVDGNFTIKKDSLITSLVGCPTQVGLTFDIGSADHITSLHGCPVKVGNDFRVQSCEKLTTLKGGPKEVGRNYIAGYNAIKKIEGLPKIIHGDLVLEQNHISNFNGTSHTLVSGSLDVTDNPIESFSKINERFSFSGVKSGDDFNCLIVNTTSIQATGLFSIALIDKISEIGGWVDGAASKVYDDAPAHVKSKTEKWKKAVKMVVDCIIQKENVLDLQTAMIDADLEEFM